MLIVCCSIPCILAVMQFVKTYKIIELLNNLKQVYEQINFILSGSAPEAVSLFGALCDRNIFPAFCTIICERLLFGASFSQAWLSGFEHVGGNLLNSTEKKELLSFADSFGLGCLEEQMRICNRFAQFCKNAVDKRKENLAKNGKLYLSGSLLFGALIFVLLF